MRRGGHNRKTRRSKVVAGTFRRDRDRAGLSASPGVPAPPPELTGAALEKWQQLVNRPGLRQTLSSHDGEALAALCISWATMMEAYNQIQRKGALVRSYRGALVKNPAVQIWRDAASALAGWLAKFGMTPRDRATVDALEEVDEDLAFDEFLRGGHPAGVVQLPQKES